MTISVTLDTGHYDDKNRIINPSYESFIVQTNSQREQMTLYGTLLFIHIAGGFLALLSAVFAILSKTIDSAHKWHVWSGRVYFAGMATVFLTAIPMAVLKPNPFLFMIAIFSFYMALSGYRLARNRGGTPQAIDWFIAGIMAVTSVAMVLFGAYWLIGGETMGITIIVFGIIGAGFSLADIRTFRAGGLKGKERIAAHLQRMMGATIATLTAFIVTNFYIEPVFILWLAPTAIITPIITIWSYKIMAGRRPKGMA